MRNRNGRAGYFGEAGWCDGVFVQLSIGGRVGYEREEMVVVVPETLDDLVASKQLLVDRDRSSTIEVKDFKSVGRTDRQKLA